MATEGFSMQRATLIVSFPRQRGKVGMDGGDACYQDTPIPTFPHNCGGNNHKGCAGSQTASRFM